MRAVRHGEGLARCRCRASTPAFAATNLELLVAVDAMSTLVVEAESVALKHYMDPREPEAWSLSSELDHPLTQARWLDTAASVL